MSPVEDLQELWVGFSRGDGGARDRLLALYYEEFRRIARRVLQEDSNRLHIQPTDLVHEASIRMIRSSGVQINDQNHFLSLAARIMRLTLIDEIRKHKAAKRGTVITLWDDAGEPEKSFDIEDFDHVLDQLSRFEPEGARIIELRFYVGLTMLEIAQVLQMSESTVQRRWRSARAWLLKELELVS